MLTRVTPSPSELENSSETRFCADDSSSLTCSTPTELTSLRTSCEKSWLKATRHQRTACLCLASEPSLVAASQPDLDSSMTVKRLSRSLSLGTGCCDMDWPPRSKRLPSSSELRRRTEARRSSELAGDRPTESEESKPKCNE